MLSKLICLLAVLLLVQGYVIIQYCGSEGCPPGCAQCSSIQGGPFDTNICLDPDTCDPTAAKNVVLTITCNGCSGAACSYTQNIDGVSLSGCVSDSDPYWPSFKAIEDLLYSVLFPSNPPYDWCGRACQDPVPDAGGLSTGALVGIIAGGVVLVAIGIVVAVKFCKTKKAENYQKV